jgi:hypothetical protein
VTAVEPPSGLTRATFRVQPNKHRHARPKPSTGLPWALLAMSFGVLLVAFSFALSRASEPHANLLFWTGQVVLYGSPAVFILTRHPTKTESIVLAIAIPVLSYGVNQSYSPIQFRFLDAFQHVQTAQAILSQHHLFTTNTSLPVSPYFPGLEIVTSALSQLGGVSIYTAGTIVVGMCHVLTSFGIFLLAYEIWRRPKIAVLAVLIYSTEPHYQFFDSYFIYEVIAMPFLIGCVLALTKLAKASSQSRLLWSAIALFTAFATTVSHHITSFVLVGFLATLTVAQGVGRGENRRAAVWMGAVTLLTVSLVAGWDLGFARGALQYLAPVADSVTRTSSSGAQQLASGNRSHTSGLGPSAPKPDVLIDYFATGLLLLLITLGALWGLRSTRSRQKNSLRRGCLALSLSIYGLVLLRLAASDGSELAGRAYAFVMIPGAMSAAFAMELITHRARIAWRNRRRSRSLERIVAISFGFVTIVALAAGGITIGWPEYYARLPGPYLVGAWERSIDSHNLLAAQWTSTNLPQGAGVASDWVTGGLLGSLGHLSNDTDTASLFLSPKITPALEHVIAQQQVRYIAVDKRITEQIPQSGTFFKNDPLGGTYTSGLPYQFINKFNTAGISKIFSDGTISIYDVTNIGTKK